MVGREYIPDEYPSKSIFLLTSYYPMTVVFWFQYKFAIIDKYHCGLCLQLCVTTPLKENISATSKHTTNEAAALCQLFTISG